tara:strand:+ start:3975 stop:5960 length:1986 start_codon:yes stop_codon:yes gene_type:complete
MPLIDLQSDLKSIKYSKDRPESGYSGQPYIQKSIDSDSEEFPNNVPNSKDFLLRGGLRAPGSAMDDTIRLSKYFTDLNSPSGFLFIAKQNLLSQTSVRTQSSKGLLNEGIYTPLSTLMQASSGYLGTHVYKQGLNPLQGTRTYMEVAASSINPNNSIISVNNNRLVKFYNQQDSQFVGTTIYSYLGGPGAPLGIGTTNINFAQDNKGAPLTTLQNTPFSKQFIKNETGLANSGTDRTTLQVYSPIGPNSGGISEIFKSFGSLVDYNISSLDVGLNESGSNGNFTKTYKSSVYQTENLVVNGKSIPVYLQPTIRQNDNGISTWDQQRIEEQVNLNNSTNVGIPTLQDFRAPLLEDQPSSSIMSTAPSYLSSDSPKTYEGVSTSRVRIMSPGIKGDRKSYTKGKIVNGKRSVVDLINFQPIYQSQGVKSEQEGINKNDLVKFRIAAINSTNPSLQQFIHFRAFINNFSDSYGASWTGQKYMGRGEQFYKYGGFSRDISIGFTVAAQSKPELMAQYKKLNFLASNLAPTYSPEGYMGGPLVQFTMGGWCYELPGFIESLSLDVPSDSTWEIGINDSADAFDNTVKEMPHRVNVSLKFTPIHNFRPEKQVNYYGGKKEGDGEISEYGEQHYIQLNNGTNNNYVPVSLTQAQDESFNGGSTGKNEQ